MKMSSPQRLQPFNPKISKEIEKAKSTIIFAIQSNMCSHHIPESRGGTIIRNFDNNTDGDYPPQDLELVECAGVLTKLDGTLDRPAEFAPEVHVIHHTTPVKVVYRPCRQMLMS